MRQNIKRRNYKITRLQNPQQGYILITLMLAFTLIAVGLLAIVPYWKQQIQRDREDELIHRGTMYMRAIQHYYKRLGRYPNRIEDLENTNNVRYLRKRYKDPMSWDPQTKKEKDFKLLHMQDVMLNGGPTLGQGTGGLPGAGGLGALGGAIPAGGFGGAQGANPLASGLQNIPGLQNAIGQLQGAGSQMPQGGLQGQSPTGSDSSGSTDSSSNSNPNSPTGSNPSSGGPTSGGQPLNGQVFGGGPILGVGSTNKKLKTIREFNKKTHYTDWYFIYDASVDRGGLLKGPWQPLVSIASGSGIGQPIGTGPGGTQPVSGQSPTPAPTSGPQGSPFQNSPPPAPNN
ncbi:MAG: hypothetical protein WBS24_15580 [Terriglobales bacterium]